jgi:chaperone LolA
MILLALTATRAGAAPGSGLEQLRQFLARTSSVTARFQQDVVAADGKVLDSAGGDLKLQRPGRFRWDYREPYERVVLADGQELWLYEADLQQVTVRRLDAGLGETPAALLTGDASMLDRFTVMANWSGETMQWVRLKPRAADSDFDTVAIAFDGGKPVELEFQDRLGQLTRIRLSDVRLNPRVPAEAFRFTVPVGVDVIRAGDL